ncbi:PqqD family protein [Bradyrhizobium prioriisuperbiae]|uniref:PqqD family protein n=1 Tax=Bradyrhizobium prioriisuperbiae TaxID=2854389 RepID=UPI0028E65B22|nr:PqqD family protein [Bradyrhizobium prioritasuperba]
MNPSVRIGTYITAVPEIASEIFDGELVIANYKSGLYYSISIEGCWIWQGLAHGLSVSQVVEWLSDHFPGQASGLVTLIEDFIGKLVTEGLVLEASTSNRAPSELPALTGEVFAPPVIERFDDLQQLLLLDPFHDVDQAGWPRRPAD